ncbi:MAG: tetratricopeptide repeat protein [Desulforegulaceae bacterium]|nr:tetratricopeptide repeat protein [Desulforegulaceae bacterium]
MYFEDKGDQAFENQLYYDAIACWNRGYHKNPDNASLLYKAGKAFLKLGDMDKALEYFIRSDQQNPNQYEIKKDIIRLYIIKGEIKKADKLLKEISSFAAGDLDYYFLSGDIYLVSGMAEKACEMYKQAVLLSNGSAKAFIKLSMGLVETKNLDEAEKYISKIIKNYILTPQENLLLSDYYFVKGDFELAEKNILEAVFSDKSNLGFKSHLCSFYFKTNQFEKVSEVLSQYVKEYPDNLEFKIFLADAFISLKELDKAEPLIEEIRLLSKDLADYNLIMGKYWLCKGRSSYAVLYLKDACKKKSYLVNTNFLLGTAYFAGGQFKLAENSLTKALTLSPNHQDSLYLMALLHYKLKEIELSLKYLEKIGELDFFNPKYSILKGLCFFEKKDFEKASDLFFQAFEIERELSSGFFLGRAREALKDYDSAISIYKTVLEENGFVEEVFFQYISLLIKTEKQKAASEELDKNISLVNKNPVTNYIFACFAIKLNNTKKAKFFLKTAIDQGFAFEGTYLKLASIYKDLGNLKETEKILLEGLKKFPSSKECILELGDYYYKTNSFEKAVLIYEKGLKLTQNSSVLMSNYAWVLAISEKELDIALDYARKAYELDSEKAFICDTLGYIYYLKGAYSQSLWMFEKAELLSPENPILKYHLGLVCFKLGQLSKAKENFELALKLGVKSEIKKEIEVILNGLGAKTKTIEYLESPEVNILNFPEKLVDDTDILTPQWD